MGKCRTLKFPFIFSRQWVGLGSEPDALTALFPRKEPQLTLWRHPQSVWTLWSWGTATSCPVVQAV